ncbi:4-hydroxy-3-methylbut-2-enyl diphosphate reductase [Slackia heliotrinireducens]|uniref:4-hydroxy-3-methylbut-2-enyl diphosphate reductase n=1 Tax=Slackia heliotrinireducens (strain ATCC 29202 / DSM 20476 / NCTC 11029 / RHS 1) TaxID=471855 RepID=C7N521_SLAHD|nr:4-hydroxy-3-methylbut-2-enyl diphosphate reductase [Slackia heliotrinireducens]ACV22006.1 (E)-4-hydroxy-3-methyl-but-2-enyl pyrophosphate reductase [Slackia heliotrinireducens DSM 20476]VEG99913.1 4-hydroxy-3-methylbut-2-enyl diphosphate reductase [Slackia heliotrinireducens]
MEILRAKHAGVCYGVERALDMVSAASMDGDEDTFTLGPLIHNPQVVAKLESRGVRAVDGPEQVDHGIVILRTHGVEPHIAADLKSRDLTVIDATCPHVAKAQRSAANLADTCGTVLIIGRAEHPEIRSVREYAGEKAIVVADVDEVPEHLEEPVGVIVQTTESKEKLQAVVNELEARGVETQVKNTICFATRQRQDAAAALADEVDAMVVIGGKNSSNTTHLYEICRDHCDRSYFVETKEELDPSWFSATDRVGVTAGASTPDYQIEDVISYLESL